MGLHMRLLQSLGRKLNVRKMDDWYRVTDTDLKAEGGAVLLETYGSLVSILETLYPNHPWDFKHATATNNTNIIISDNQPIQQVISSAHITALTKTIFVSSLGCYATTSTAKPVGGYFSEKAILYRCSKEAWHQKSELSPSRCNNYLVSSFLLLQKMDDWASVTPHELKALGGAGLLAHYNGFLGEALHDTFPTIPIDMSKFFKNQRSPAFWKDIRMQHKFFQALGEKLGVMKVILSISFPIAFLFLPLFSLVLPRQMKKCAQWANLLYL